MIIPSIDIRNGRAVQLRRGEEMILDGGDPLDRLDEFSPAGEVAVIDLDAALGMGSNTELIREMVRRARIRVGGGIRTLSDALDWLDSGVEHIIIGTAATPEFCSQLPRNRIIAAVDARKGQVVVNGWRTTTTDSARDRVERLAPFVGGFLFTQVEFEGGLSGFDLDAVHRVVAAAQSTPSWKSPENGRYASPRVTIAGGITTTEEIRELDRLGADAQVGMALYTGALSLGGAVAAPLKNHSDDALWPTVVVDESGQVLGLVWSNVVSIGEAVRERKGIYWSRSRNQLWVKGATSGNTQELLRIDLDCDRDSLRFTVRQRGVFCHTGTRSCFGYEFSLGHLERQIRKRISSRNGESGTVKLATDPYLLRSKLIEEAGEFAEASATGSTKDVILEAADVLYFLSVGLAKNEVPFDRVVQELAMRNKRIRRRAMEFKKV